MRLQDALVLFVVQIEADGRSPHTVAQYRRHIALLASWLAQEGLGDEVDELSHEILARFLVAPQARTARLGGSKKATSMNALRTSMRAFFSYCRDAGWARENPARLIRRARCGPARTRTLSEQDQKLLLSTLADASGREAQRDYVLFALLVGTGLRLSAALGLRAEDIDLDRCEALVRECKGNRTEIVYLNGELRVLLARFLAVRPSGHLFVGCGSRPLTRRHAARRLNLWLERAGCRQASPHALRRAFGTRVYRATRDLLLTQAALHHRAISSTLAYVALDEGRLRTALRVY